MKRLLLVVLLLSSAMASASGAPNNLEREVRSLIAAQRGRMRVSVAIVAVERGETVLVDAHAMRPLASVFKLPLLIDLARRMQSGGVDGRRLALDQSLTLREDEKCIGSGRLRYRPAGSPVKVAEAIELMETISDNTATDLLFNHIGLDSVNRMMVDLGFHETDIYLTNRAAWLISLGMGSAFRGLSARAITQKWAAMSVDERSREVARITSENRATSLTALQHAEDASRARPYLDDMHLAEAVDNLSSASDLARLLVKLQGGQLLDARWTAYCLGVLRRQRYNTRIPRDLPPGTRTFHKTGTIEGVVNDAGIVEVSPNDHVVVVVLVSDVARGADGAAESLIARIARAAYDAYR